LTRKT